MMKEIPERFECDKLLQREEVGVVFFAQLIVQTVKCLQQSEESIKIRRNTVGFVVSEESVGGTCSWALIAMGRVHVV